MRGNTAFICRFLPKANHINGTWKELMGQTFWLQQPSSRVDIPVTEPHCFCVDIFRQLLLSLDFKQVSENDREGKAGNDREDTMGKSYKGQKWTLSLILVLQWEPRTTKQNPQKHLAHRHCYFGHPSSDFFSTNSQAFLFKKKKKVINTNDPAFTLNFHLSQGKRKAVNNFFF